MKEVLLQKNKSGMCGKIVKFENVVITFINWKRTLFLLRVFVFEPQVYVGLQVVNMKEEIFKVKQFILIWNRKNKDQMD